MYSCSNKAMAPKMVVGVDNASGTAYGQPTGLYNKHQKYSEQWNLRHPFRSAHNFQHDYSLTQQTDMWIDRHLRCGQVNIKIKSFESANTLGKLIAQLDFRLYNHGWIDHDLHIFGTLYYRHIFNCVQFILAHLPFQAHHNLDMVRL
jgi:hypothetical protein